MDNGDSRANYKTTNGYRNTKGKGGKNKKGKTKNKDLNKKGEAKESQSEVDAFITPEVKSQPNTASPDPEENKEELLRVAEKNEENSKVTQDLEENEKTADDVGVESAATEEAETGAAEGGEEEGEPSTRSIEDLRQAVIRFYRDNFVYKDDQWSPENTGGKKQYDREFLIKLQTHVVSTKKPEGLPNLEVVKDTLVSARGPDRSINPMNSNYRMGAADFTPGYVRSANNARGGGGRGSTSRGGNHSGGRKVDPPKKIISTSLSQDVKLHETENAWKFTFEQNKPENPNEMDDEALFKRVRGILNRLTPQKFNSLVEKLMGLPINNEKRLLGTIDLIFEKALQEPSFCVAYANLCKRLAALQVTESGAAINFRKVLITRCQKEFEKDSTMQKEKEKRLEAIRNEADQEKKKLLQEEHEVKELEERRRSLGNIRLIGELYKLQMLTAPIMHTCVSKLLASREDEPLECLVRLLTTIGKDLQNDAKSNERDFNQQEQMNTYINKIKDIISKKQASARVRFLLQDVVDLKQNNWVPRRDEAGPKTIDQIHREAERENQEREFMLMSGPPPNPRDKGDRGGDRDRMDRGDRDRNRRRVGDDGWNTVGSKSSSSSSNNNQRIDPSKMKITKVEYDDNNIQLGPAGRGFSSWSKGSSAGNTAANRQQDERRPTPNRFNLLQGDRDDYTQRKPLSGRPSGSGPPSRDSSTPRGGMQQGGGPSTSQQRGGMMSRPREQDDAIQAAKQLDGSAKKQQAQSGGKDARKPTPPPTQASAAQTGATAKPEIQDLEGKSTVILDEFFSSLDKKEAVQCISDVFMPSHLVPFLSYAIGYALDKSIKDRNLMYELIEHLLESGFLSLPNYVDALTTILDGYSEWTIDVPHFWKYLAETIYRTISKGPLTLRLLLDAGKTPIDGGQGGKLISAVLKSIAAGESNKVAADLWNSSGLEWRMFLAPNKDVDEFLQTTDLFKIFDQEAGGAAAAAPAPVALPTRMTFDDYVQHLTPVVAAMNSNEHIFDWIQTKLTKDQTTETAFIRALVTAVIRSALKPVGPPKMELNEKLMKQRTPVLCKYLDNQESNELQALYAIQALVHKMEHPPGLIAEIFNMLYDDELISEDAYKAWERSDDPAEQEGKGVAQKSTLQFFTWLAEAEADDQLPEES